MIQTIIGDVRQRLRDLPDKSVDCIVTSPPYFSLRDYGCDGQIGLEATPDAYVAELVNVFREARRVLRPDGTLWLNLGDSYAGSTPHGLAAKQRLMIPARVALALQADGWWLRDEIIWHKPNPMPVSVTDRTTPAHEMLYMFSKSARYYYDMDAIKEPVSQSSIDRWGKGKKRTASTGSAPDRNDAIEGFRGETTCGVAADGMRQPRSVWSISTKPFKGAHFATFPPDLIKPCILAGCPAGGTVLDPFFGAGTTGLVAQQLGRNAIGIELNPEYAAIAQARIDATQPETDLR